MRIAFFNPHGNFDKKDSYITEHPDFGGQLVYVKQLAVAFAEKGHTIDIFTRQIVDSDWKKFYEEFDYYEGIDNVKIIRIPFSTLKFLPKEELWKFITTEFIPEIIGYYKKIDCLPDVVAAQYADGGLSAAYYTQLTGIPYTFTGHSLGAQKMDKFNINQHNITDYEKQYKFSKRLTAERIAMFYADKIITSTKQERFEQYSHNAYANLFNCNDDNKFNIITPGVALNVFNKTVKFEKEEEVIEHIDLKIQRDISPNRLNLPCIIVSSRPDEKKNHISILQTFKLHPELIEKYNILIITRHFNNPFRDYKNYKCSESKIIIKLVEFAKENDLIGKIAMFSLSGQNELAVAYRYLIKRKSVFLLPALYEPFGLAPIEAMVSGLPVVVTKFGGPSESLIRNNEKFGFLIDPTDYDEMAEVLLKLADNIDLWNDYSKRGYEYASKNFSWIAAAAKYLECFEQIKKSKRISEWDMLNNNLNLFNDENIDISERLKFLKKIYTNI